MRTRREVVDAGDSPERLDASTQAIPSGGERDRFLANMSHEVRTPMNAIIGMIDLVLNSELKDRQRRHLTAARHAAENLTRLLSDIIEYSKADRGGITLSAVPVETRRVVHEVAGLFEAETERKGLQMAVTVAPEVPVLVIGDSFHLRRVLVALVDNAVKFSFDGGIELRVSLIRANADHVSLRWDVADTGIGIPPEKLGTITDLFTQGEDNLARRFGGIGLGLALASRLVERMGGRLAIESELGLGTMVSFELPLGRTGPSGGTG